MSRYGSRGQVHVANDEELVEEYGSNINVTNVTIDAADFNPDDFEVSAEHQIGIATTIDHSEKPATRKDYRSRLQRMVDWCVANYPNYASIATRRVTEEELNDTTKHYYNIKEPTLFMINLVIKLCWHSFLSSERRMQMVQVRLVRMFMYVNSTMQYCLERMNRV